MLNEFSRAQLLLGKEAMETLADSRVAVFGIGGVGSFAAEALEKIDDEAVREAVRAVSLAWLGSSHQQGRSERTRG